ncbi:inositol monophosphatase family protein [Nocardioides pacificus]
MDTDAVLVLMQEVAADIIEPRFRSLADHEVMEKNPGDLVTVADHEAEVAITRRLQEAFPDALIVGEEAVAADASLLEGLDRVDHWFTVDPVDGTRNFVHGSPDHAVMIGEILAGEIVRGWIWQPAHGRSYVAERGAGAWADGVRLEGPEPKDPRHPRGVTSMRGRVGTAPGDLAPMELSWVCCGVDFPQVVTGGTDYVLYGMTKPWDHVPGTLLTREVGGSVVHPDGSDYLPTDIDRPVLVSATSEVRDTVLPLL